MVRHETLRRRISLATDAEAAVGRHLAVSFSPAVTCPRWNGDWPTTANRLPETAASQ